MFKNARLLLYQIEYWLKSNEIIDSSSTYWDNEENEKDKEWYILNGNFTRMENFLNETGLKTDLLFALDFMSAKFQGRPLIGADLAAGNAWCAPFISEKLNIETLYCLEYSRHRIEKLGPALLSHYHVPPSKIKLVHGSFYDLKIPEKSLDFVILCQAFHHADDPNQLLREVKRVLKPGGLLIVIGEHKIEVKKAYAKNFVKTIIGKVAPGSVLRKAKKEFWGNLKLFPTFNELFPADEVTGDHYYRSSDYDTFFSTDGLKILKQETRKDLTSFFIERV